ncbi:uncharacterized protein BT62DRAFT_934210 [Guyanagaster necrorhizus]|uniref:Uncharacterized protein n=1 Tax=Guyanagaster necrorhizus TaxID=856835 RepID=A0A9P7VQF5_9AGAR|nr:uncharacterized protein BT62DRAFT_934210 [Guyanagaster necrorhizus MCA 3950]KAG7444570.1 hypothetical protein BT62DRAFT_934210 [Guyanagaster necrorhizus MCA 3950]
MASLNSVQSRFARRPRGSLRLSPHNSRIQPAVGIDEDDDTSSSFFVVTAADLPISLDSPQQPWSTRPLRPPCQVWSVELRFVPVTTWVCSSLGNPS